MIDVELENKGMNSDTLSIEPNTVRLPGKKGTGPITAKGGTGLA
jgi:hypothetical protein